MLENRAQNLNASTPSDLSIPESGGKLSKRLGGIIGCKDKTSSSCRGEAHTVIQYTYIIIAMQGHQPNQNKNNVG